MSQGTNPPRSSESTTEERDFLPYSQNDRHPNIPAGNFLHFNRQRPRGFLNIRQRGDPLAVNRYGDEIFFKDPKSTRIMFQNVKGLTYTTSTEDYRYYLQGMSSYSADIFGMAETNTSWQHPHLQLAFRDLVQRQFQYGKTVHGFLSKEIDPIPTMTSFQAGGTTQVVKGGLTTTVQNPLLLDPTGLGRWCGMTFEGKAGRMFSVITGYRVC